MTRRSRKTRTYGVRALRSERGCTVQSLASRRLVEFPLVRQPSIQFAQLRLRQVHQQLGEIQLRIQLVSAASAGQAGEDCRGATATRVPSLCANQSSRLPGRSDERAQCRKRAADVRVVEQTGNSIPEFGSSSDPSEVPSQRPATVARSIGGSNQAVNSGC